MSETSSMRIELRIWLKQDKEIRRDEGDKIK